MYGEIREESCILLVSSCCSRLQAVVDFLSGCFVQGSFPQRQVLVLDEQVQMFAVRSWHTCAYVNTTCDIFSVLNN